MNSRFNGPAPVLFLSILMLVLLSFIKPEGKVGPIEVKRIDLFSDIVKTTGSIRKQGKDMPPAIGTKRPETEAVGAGEKRASSTISLTEDSPGTLDNFFRDLLKTEKKGGIVRIAYFGDSIIEGDLITQDLRKNLQARFGGGGVGFVPITSVAARCRNTIHHSFSKNWQTFSLHQRSSDSHILGVSGFAFMPKSDRALTDSPTLNPGGFGHSWVEYESGRLYNNTNTFSTIRLFYGTVKDTAFIRARIDNNSEQTIPLEQGETLRVIRLDNNGSSRKVRLQFFSSDIAIIYGVSFDENQGIFVDNYSIRGYSGVTLNRLACPTLSAFSGHLNHKLAILHYGLNMAAFTTKREFAWYRNQMIDVVNHFKSCLPNTSILVVSVNDVGVRQGTDIVTKPSIPMLVEAQEQVAKRTGVAFWNLFQAMGGENSMVAWVHDKKPLAMKDYTHFNHRGAKRVADLLTEALMKEYEKYKSKKASRENGGYAKHDAK